MPTATPFNNLITFSRGSNATVTGSNGLIQWAANNNATFSEQFDNAAWVKNSSSIAANVTTSPDGTRTADTWTPTSNGNTGAVRLLGTFTIPVGPNATTSIYVKSAGKRWVYLTTPAALSPLHNCWFDLQTGAVGTMGSGVLAATMTAVGDGWYRISTTSATTLATNYVFLSATDADNSTTVVADGTGVHIWGAQLELGSTATTYNPTTVKNLLGFSEAFDNAAWTKSNSSIVTGAQANPINGLFTAQKLMENTANSVHRFIVGATVTAIPYTLSIYAKAAERNWIAVGNTSGAGQLAHFNLSNGTVGTIIGGVTAAITSIGSGWYRCSVTFTPAAGAITIAVWLASADNTLTYTGDGNSGVYIYGAQLSDSASLDPYVPTPGAAPSSTAFYGPRFDFDPVTLQPRGLLVEEQRTNLALRSDDFANASWVKSDVNVTANSAVAPDGTTTADLLIPTAVNTVHTVVQTITTPASSMVFSFYAKPGGYNFIQVHDGTSGTDYINFDLSTGVVGNLSGYTGAITAVGSGWYRCTAIKTFTAAAHEFRLNPLDANTASRRPSFAGNGTSGVLVWGAQLEAGAFATSYIPTVASTVTRSADVATITGQNFAQWYGQSAGSFVVDADGFNKPGQYSNTFFTENIQAGIGNANWRAYNGTTNGLLAGFGSAVDGVPAKTAIAYQTGASQSAGSLNGAAVATFTNPDLIATAFRIGGPPVAGGTPNYLNGHIRNIRFIPARAADFQLQALTT